MASSKKPVAAPAKPVAAKKPGVAVARSVPKPTAVGQPAAMTELYEEHAGVGLERATMRDFALPFLYLLQKNSPQVDENDDRFVEGAKAGMFINTVTGELFDELQVVPCDFQKVYNEWVPRDAGGGFRHSWPTEQEAGEGKEEDTQIVETANHYVLVQQEDGTWAHAVLSLTSTKLKASRNWLSRISQRMIDTSKGRKVAPSFACVYTVTSVSDKNDKGTFFTVAVAPVEGEDGWVQDEEVFNMALDFRRQLNSGLLKVEYTKDPEAAEVAADEPATGKKKF